MCHRPLSLTSTGWCGFHVHFSLRSAVVSHKGPSSYLSFFSFFLFLIFFPLLDFIEWHTPLTCKCKVGLFVWSFFFFFHILDSGQNHQLQNRKAGLLILIYVFFKLNSFLFVLYNDSNKYYYVFMYMEHCENLTYKKKIFDCSLGCVLFN